MAACVQRGVKVVTNAGGLDRAWPATCASSPCTSTWT